MPDSPATSGTHTPGATIVPAPATSAAPVPESTRSRGPLAMRHASFRRLTVAWVATNLGDSALYLVLAIWVRQLTGSDSAAGLVFAFLGLPALLAPLAGQVADRVSRQRLLVVTNLAVALVVLSLLFVRDASGIWLIYAATFCYGLAAYVTAAAQSGLLRDMLDDEEIPGANGLLTTIDQGLRLISPLIGTGLYVLAGPHLVAGLTAVCFMATAAIIATIRVQESVADPGDREGAWREITAGARVLLNEPTLRLFTVALAAGFGVTGFINVAIFPMLEEGLGVGAELLALMVTFQGVGAVCGGITAARAIRRVGERRVTGLGLAISGSGVVATLAFIATNPPGTAWTIAIAAIIFAFTGLGIPWTIVAVSTYRMRVTPRAAQGRTAAAMNMAFNVPQTAATLVGAAVLAVLDYRILLAICALVMLACGMSCRPWSAREPRGKAPVG